VLGLLLTDASSFVLLAVLPGAALLQALMARSSIPARPLLPSHDPAHHDSTDSAGCAAPRFSMLRIALGPTSQKTVTQRS
jgi:hypothetical protein